MAVASAMPDRTLAAGCDAAQVVDAAAGVLDQVAVPVSLAAVADGALAVAAARDERRKRAVLLSCAGAV